MIEILEKLCCGQNTLAANVDVVILQEWQQPHTTDEHEITTAR